MAKRKVKPKPATKEEIDAAFQRLDEHFKLGKRLRKEAPANKKARQKLAEGSAVSTSDSNLQKTRQLADLLYGKFDENLDQKSGDDTWLELRALRLKDTDLPLSWSHVVALVSAGTGTKLLQVAKKAARFGWSSSQIRQYLQRDTGCFSRRPGTGRSVRKPKNLKEGLQQLLADLGVVSKRVTVLRKLLGNQSAPSRLADDLAVLERAAEAIRISGAIDL